MQIIEIKDDILTAPDSGYMLCHCVSLDCVMNNGVSYRLTKKFAKHGWSIEYYCRKYVRYKNNGALGTAYKTGHHPLYSLFVKKRNYEEYSDSFALHLNHALTDLKNQMVLADQTLLAMPKLGCSSRERGDWVQVRDMIAHIFEDTDIEIKVYY